MMIHGGDIYRHKIEYDFSVNVNPLGTPENVKKACVKACEEMISVYPDIACERLRENISEDINKRALGVSCEKVADKDILVSADDIICGNGASELFMAIMHGIKSDMTFIPTPSFYGYEWVAGAMQDETHINYFALDAADGFSFDDSTVDRLVREIKACESDKKLVFLANPNNPTGRLIKMDCLMRLISELDGLGGVLVLDECFIELCDTYENESYVDGHLGDLLSYKNVIVVRAFTKSYAMPGIRLGYMITKNDEIKERVRRVLPEWNISTVAIEAGIAAFSSGDYLSLARKIIKEEKNYLSGELAKLGVKVYESDTNFLLIKVDNSIDLYEQLLSCGILIRDCCNYRGLTKGYYRICVKQHAENEILVGKIKGILENGDRYESGK